LTLAIESAIAGGSLSLLDGTGREIANWVGGDADVARAEDLLINIDGLLSSAGVSKRDLALIAVSAGPGSFTGIRIGMATALGLKNGLGIPMSSLSALEATCRTAGSLPAGAGAENTQAGSLRSDVVVAVPVGRNSICIQSFNIDERGVMATSEPRTIPENEIEKIEGTVLMHAALFAKYGSAPNAIDLGANIANAIGRAASPGVVTEPLFVSKSV